MASITEGLESRVKEILSGNKQYASGFDLGSLPSPPKKNIFILTCMDARIDPLKVTGLNVGDTHVYRNAGGRVTEDAIRSAIISHKFLASNLWLVIHHTGCGMEGLTNEAAASLFEHDLETCKKGANGFEPCGKGPGSSAGKNFEFHGFKDAFSSVTDDINTLKNHPLVNKNIPIYGFVYDVKSGQLLDVK